MKKKILTLAIAILAVMSVNAQSTDGFFSKEAYTEYREESWGMEQNMPLLPGHGIQYDFAAEPVSVGTGLLILAGLGLAYGMKKN